ncbi:MAG: DEAD/DEAH box helicase [Bacteroidota bacterium]
MSFEEYGLSPDLVSGLSDIGITSPTPLLNEVLPQALESKHLMVKQLAGEDGVLLIPALWKLTSDGEQPGTRVLILTPSIERAKALDEQLWAAGYHAGVSSALLAMNGDKAVQAEALNEGASIIVANPGRLIEIIKKTEQNLNQVQLIILDQAHGMGNYNMVQRVRDIRASIAGAPQVILLAEEKNEAVTQLSSSQLEEAVIIGFETDASELIATEQTNDSHSKQQAAEEKSNELPQAEVEEEGVDPLVSSEQLARAEEKLKKASISIVLKKDIEEKAEPSPAEEETESDSPGPIPEKLDHRYILVPPRAKISTLMAYLSGLPSVRVAVFAASKRTTDRLYRIIRNKGIGVVSINEGLDPEFYTERFERFKSGEVNVLLAGGLNAEQVDLDSVTQIINYDVPGEVDEYRYRAGLVGKGSLSGMTSLVYKIDREDMDRISEEVGFAPSEIPLPKEVKEKKSSNGKDKPKPKPKPNKKSTSNKKGSPKKPGRRPPQKKKRSKPSASDGLPRPSYEGLEGGRDGKKSGGGLLGWMKKLFD